jgi:hypothetical protein
VPSLERQPPGVLLLGRPFNTADVRRRHCGVHETCALGTFTSSVKTFSPETRPNSYMPAPDRRTLGISRIGMPLLAARRRLLVAPASSSVPATIVKAGAGR